MVTVSVDNMVRVHNYKLMPHAIHEKLRKMYEFRNPAYDQALKYGKYTRGIDERLVHWEVSGDTLIFPRGTAKNIISFLNQNRINHDVKDNRGLLNPVHFEFNGVLRPYQEEALCAIKRRDSGCLIASTGSGKTTVGLAAIAARKQPTLIVVHVSSLLQQWAERVEQFLGIPRKEIGIISGGKVKVGEKITIALVQTLCSRAKEISNSFGHVVVDEAHHTPSKTFIEAISALNARYILGLSATPWRKDGLSRLMWWYLGDKIHEVDAEKLKTEGHILKAQILVRHTNISQSQHDPTTEYSSFITDLLKNDKRNSLICDDVVSAVNQGRTCIVLSDRVSHCISLGAMLKEKGVDVGMLTGTIKEPERSSVLSAGRSGELKVILATSSLAGEGLDIPSLDTLFLVCPVKFKGRLIQYVGRILRPSKNKHNPLIYDYQDDFGVLKAQAASRQKVYESGIAA